MLPYVIAGVLAVVLLYAAFRTFGGAASQPVDPNVLLRTALDIARAAVHELRSDSTGDVAPAAGKGGDPARALRRRLDGAGQLLQQVDAGDLDDSGAAAHAVLSVAVEELSWSLRLRQSPGYAAGGGMHAAVDALLEHAGRCIAEAVALVPGSAVAEEVRGAT